MTHDDFVRRVRTAVYETSIQNIRSLLEEPPGRMPSSALCDISRWYHLLTSEDKVRLDAIIAMSVGDAVFGMLTVLDGDRSVRMQGEPVGSFELYYNVNGTSVMLNRPGDGSLHERFSELVPPV